MRSKKCQSILEYIIVLTVIIVAIALVSNSIRDSVVSAMNKSASTVSYAANQLP
jgi:hypothetical protein